MTIQKIPKFGLKIYYNLATWSGSVHESLLSHLGDPENVRKFAPNTDFDVTDLIFGRKFDSRLGTNVHICM
jgi:hypothetical protein